MSEKGVSVDATTRSRSDEITESDIAMIAGGVTPIQLASGIEPLLMELVVEFGNRELEDLGVDPSFGVVDARVVGYITEVAVARIPKITRTTQKEVALALAEGVLQGEGEEALGRRVRAVFKGISRSRANLIARTEVGTAANWARHAAMEEAEEAGIVHKKKWLATKDNRTRHNHLALDGQVQPVRKPFRVPFSGKTAMYPGGFADVRENANCRCTLIPVVAPASLDRKDAEVSPEEEKIRKSIDQRLYPWDRKLEDSVRGVFRKQEKIVMEMLHSRFRAESNLSPIMAGEQSAHVPLRSS